MLKKLATVIMAAAFAMAVYTPSASACPGMDDSKVAEKKKDTKKKKTVVKKDDKKKKKSDKKKSEKKPS